jgi:hypothetical protein
MKILYKSLFIFLVLVFTGTSFSQIDILLRKSFIDSIKYNVLIDADYYVVKMHEHPNPPSKDGDMHIAGYSHGIDLPVVSEIMNAKYEKEAVDTLRSYEGGNNPVHLIGVWRIWCEHSGSDRQDQGTEFPPIVDTNPDHVFEIHPVTMVENIDITNSLRGIEGYTYKKAGDAFNRYSKAKCRLEDLGNKILIETKGVGYNYAEFRIEISDSTQFITADGRIVSCKVLDDSGNAIYKRMSMVFPEGSEAEKRVKDLSAGQVMHVLGIPRIDLSLVSYRIKHAAEHSYMLEWNLPVEMIIVAYLDNNL